MVNKYMKKKVPPHISSEKSKLKQQSDITIQLLDQNPEYC